MLKISPFQNIPGKKDIPSDQIVDALEEESQGEEFHANGNDKLVTRAVIEEGLRRVFWISLSWTRKQSRMFRIG